ncbi:hypothetical protein PLEOSDRAFT_1114287 [Pleurotus ostreatus PC15]|uniref:YjgF-like protein n=1 Tax=Pleurotus ostreatus (strain PC15) TaxID=1137138 RepID=A0A067N5H1_PLEO1|nr:hypothetical protein PLEOSDRAFT_1114287 [Pleurotus ostreatus PC15]
MTEGEALTEGYGHAKKKHGQSWLQLKKRFRREALWGSSLYFFAEVIVKDIFESPVRLSLNNRRQHIYEHMERFTTSNPYEAAFGYSRAIRRGPHVFVSGTTSIDPTTGAVLFPDSAYLQTQQIFKEIIRALEGLGTSKEDVVRLRIFVTEQSDAGEVGRAMKEAFGDVGPAATMIVGAQFVRAEMKVEIEADAITL